MEGIEPYYVIKLMNGWVSVFDDQTSEQILFDKNGLKVIASKNYLEFHGQGSPLLLTTSRIRGIGEQNVSESGYSSIQMLMVFIDMFNAE
jgi:hypothetical protein